MMHCNKSLAKNLYAGLGRMQEDKAIVSNTTCPEKGTKALALDSLLPQEYSWGSLVISFEGIRKLLSSLAIHPSFIDVLRTFGEKTNFEDDSCESFHFHHAPVTGSHGRF
jgi:hypothetical protein